MNRSPSRLPSLAAALLVAALLLSGCAVERPRAESPAPAPVDVQEPPPSIEMPEYVAIAAMSTVSEMIVRDAPDGAETHRFAHPIASGAPLTFLVEEEQGGWLRVQLPVRPNGASGWIARSDVTVALLQYSLHVSVEEKTLTVRLNGADQAVYPVATGTGGTPTPTGAFYLTELIIPTNGGYGPYAYGLSAHSEVLTSFGGGPGQIGLHGTEDAASIGQAASHGCLRLSNEDITALAALLPLGTPITIV